MGGGCDIRGGGGILCGGGNGRYIPGIIPGPLGGGWGNGGLPLGGMKRGGGLPPETKGCGPLGICYLVVTISNKKVEEAFFFLFSCKTKYFINPSFDEGKNITANKYQQLLINIRATEHQFVFMLISCEDKIHK